MVRHHLPPEHATPARAYLAAFLGEHEASDAMHEVVDDVTYWGDDSLPAVLAAAHSVLVSRVRVTPEAAASWLIEELGLPHDTAARVTGADSPAVDLLADTTAAGTVDPSAELAVEPAAEPTASPDSPAPASEASTPLRIGFEDDGPLSATLFVDQRPSAPARVVAGIALVAVLVVVVVLLLSR